ncbi:hypothetical protein OG866_27015 [Streptomyces sp. NBC_00663]|uniref:hypothetical protein n=1 Tax=Streptomyces sp. NBC_00663 TaxID=2975801 RepID=UPI002E3440BC|nr:hypothetical protein [Streptomyces sp. NBC_00663]
MADHDARERFLALAEGVVGAYAYIASLLSELPVPVIIPDLVLMADEGRDPTDALLALHRVRAVVEDEPISEKDRRCFEHLMLDWITAYEMLALAKSAGLAPWRLDAVEFALNRVVTWIEVIENDDEQDDDES